MHAIVTVFLHVNNTVVELENIASTCWWSSCLPGSFAFGDATKFLPQLRMQDAPPTPTLHRTDRRYCLRLLCFCLLTASSVFSSQFARDRIIIAQTRGRTSVPRLLPHLLRICLLREVVTSAPDWWEKLPKDASAFALTFLLKPAVHQM